MKVRDHCDYAGKYRGAAENICNSKFDVPNEIPVIFDNGSNYDYLFIKKELSNEFEKQFECLGENTERCKTLSIPRKKLIKMSMKVLQLYLTKWNLLILQDDNPTEGIHKIKCKDCDFFLEYENVKDSLMKYKCSACNKDFSNKIDEELKKRFKKTFKFSNNDINHFFCC